MSKETFNAIVRDTVPYLYSRPTYSFKSGRFRYLRAKVVMATLIRYLAIQSDQHTLGKELKYGSHASARGSIGGVEHSCLPTTTRDVLTRKFHFR